MTQTTTERFDPLTIKGETFPQGFPRRAAPKKARKALPEWLREVLLPGRDHLALETKPGEVVPMFSAHQYARLKDRFASYT